MSSFRLDYRFFVYVFVCFTVSSLMVTAIMVYYISQIVDAHGKNTWTMAVSSEDKALQGGNLWSRDPVVMQRLVDVRAHGIIDAVNLTQVIFNDSCFGFVWTRFQLRESAKYKVLIANLKVPTMRPISAVITGLEFVQCDLNVSTPYLVTLTALGGGETASAIMWTTHQVPPPPDLPRIVSVTETTITVTLPSATLTQGPLTALEVRIKPAATNRTSGEPQPRRVFWATLLKRHTRSSPYLQPGGALQETVDGPHSMLQSAPGHGAMQDRRTGNGLFDQRSRSLQDGEALGDDVVPHKDVPDPMVPHKDVPDPMVPYKVVINEDVGNSDAPATMVPYNTVINKNVRNKDVPDKDVRNNIVPNKVMSKKHFANEDTVESEPEKGSHAWIKNQQERMKSRHSGQTGFGTNNSNRAGDRHEDKVHAATGEGKEWPGHTRHKLNPTRPWPIVSADSFNAQPLEKAATSGDLMESKTTDNEQLHAAITNFTSLEDDISRNDRHASGQHHHISDVTWLEADINLDLEAVFDLSRWRGRQDLLQSASPGEDMAWPQQLVKNVELLRRRPGHLSDNSSLYVQQVSPRTHDMQDTGHPNTACPQCQHHTDILGDHIKTGPSAQRSPGSSWNILGLTSKMARFARKFLGTRSRHIVSRFVRQGTRAGSRGKRSILGFGVQRHRRRTSADAVREIEDRLDVDSYQTSDVLMSSTGQPLRVKTGYGYFVTDHYGVRHPYFNNSLLERGLRRQARYQEAKDFVLYGKSLLNLTGFPDLDFHLLYTRLNKVIEVNRVRRNKLFLDMFEDFLFWNQDRGDNQLEGSVVPPEAKLGLPPGVPVARVLTDELSHNVTIGNDQEHDRLPNPPLEPGTEYEVVVVVLSTVVDVTKHAWISVNISTLPQQPRLVSTRVLVVIGAVAAAGLLACLLTHLVLWWSAAPPGGVREDVQPPTIKTRSTEAAVCCNLGPAVTSSCDLGVSLIEPGGHVMDTSSMYMSGSEPRWPREKISSVSLCDDINNTDNTNHGYLCADKEPRDIVAGSADAAGGEHGHEGYSTREIPHQRKLARTVLGQRAEHRPPSGFSLAEVV